MAAANANLVVLIGNVSRKSQLRQTPKGVAVTDFTLAINKPVTGEEGEVALRTTFVDVTVWRKTAEFVASSLEVGTPVYLQGHLDLETWGGSGPGSQKSKLKVVGDDVQILARVPEFHPATSNP